MRTVGETFQPDFPYRVRQWLGPIITKVGRTFGQPEYRLRDTEYVGTIQRPLDEFTERLKEDGFEWDPFAWYHHPPVGSEPDGSWAYRRGPLADRQLHVILIARSPEHIDVFAHDEYNWLRHPIKHIQQVDIKREAGSSEIRRWIESQDIAVTVKSRHRRRLREGLTGFRKYLGSISR